MNKDTTLQHPKYDRLTNVVSLRSDFDQPAEQMVTDQAWQKILQLAEKPLVNQ